METSQINLIKEQVFLKMRETLVEALIDHGVLQHHDNQAGWWANTPTGPTWISVYDVLEAARD